MRHPARQHIPRHQHEHGFAALLLRGGYVEAGDTGRHWLEPGDVLFHEPWERHLDRFDRCGAEVLILDLPGEVTQMTAGRVDDPDLIVRLAERDPAGAAEQLVLQAVAKPQTREDWPDLLAKAIRDDPSLVLKAWADDMDLHIGSVSRGFGQVFGVTPMAYRLTQRTRRAIDAVLTSPAALSAVALDCYFADQAHMSRSIKAMAGASPGALRGLRGAG